MIPAYKPTLLTIDDEESIRSSLAAFFEDCGFTVIEAGDGREGLEIIRERRPDVVITDLRMPEVDGLEVVDAVCRMDDNLPIIMLSGTGVLADAIEALRRGAWDYITKPVQDMVELELMVARCLERARLVRENRAYHEGLELLVANRTKELRKLSKAVEQSANSVVITDVTGIIEYVNPKFCEVTGYSFDEVIGKNPRILKSGKQSGECYRELWQAISTGREWRGEFNNKRKNGEFYWEMCSIAPIRDETNTITHYVAIKEDISDRKAYEERLFYQANYDTLTGLPNRFHLQSYLELQLDILNREHMFLNLLLLDIDNLKFVNDTFGHEFGDKLLKEISQRLSHICGSEYLVTRFVGDEFVIVPSLHVKDDDPVAHAEMVRSAMNGAFVVDGTELVATASIGIVSYPEDGECVTSLLKNAEAAMYQAKKNGKNTIEYYTREFNSRLMERFELETKLHRALERGEFSLNYQPQVKLPSGDIVGMEALLRWTPEGESPVSPAVFIPLLEETGLIVAVGEWVLWQVCSQCVTWQQNGLPSLRVSINLSALQFMRSDLDVTVKRVLDTTGLDPRLLCLELTESMVMSDCERTMDTLDALTRTGARLSLDDFGTGYSSLSYLGRLPISELKIDQSFVRRMLTTKNDAAVVNTIIAMGIGLEMELVAEGVETEEQLQYISGRNCGIIQGFLFSRPLPPDQFELFVREWNPLAARQRCLHEDSRI
jgi:diguanylate cyclase (GGDEF)-like protein/PAS domain S-box-containing protein